MNSLVQQTILLGSGRARRGLDAFDWFCVLALLLSFLVVSRLPATASKYGDMYFHDEAKTLANAFHGVASWDKVAFGRAPGPVLYYGLPYIAVPPGSSDDTYWRVALGWNAAWMLVAILLIRRSGELLGGAAAGKMAAALALLVPFAVYYSYGIAAETPAYVATVIFLYGWARWRAEPTGRTVSGGSLLALAGLFGLILCRPNALAVTGVAALCSFLWWARRSPRRTIDGRFAMLCILSSLLMVFLASTGLKFLPGTRGVATQAANLDEAMFLSSFQFRSEPWDWRFWGKATRRGSVDYQDYASAQNALQQQAAATGATVAHLQMDWALRDIVQHPWKHLRMSAVRALALNVWIVNSKKPGDFRLGPLKGWTVFLLFHVLLNAIALLTILASIWFLMAHRAEFLADWPLWGLWVALLLFHALTYAEPRYMLPAQPGLTIMAACVFGRKVAKRERVASEPLPARLEPSLQSVAISKVTLEKEVSETGP